MAQGTRARCFWVAATFGGGGDHHLQDFLALFTFEVTFDQGVTVTFGISWQYPGGNIFKNQLFCIYNGELTLCTLLSNSL